MRPLTTVTISAPTTPPNNPSSIPMLRPSLDWNRQDWNSRCAIGAEQELERKCPSKRKYQVDGGYRVDFLERAGRMGVIRDSVTNAEGEPVRHLHSQRNVIVQQRIGRT